MGIERNPKDSMVSTWRDHPETWNWRHHILHTLDSWHADPNTKYPVFQKSDPIPYLTQWSCHRWILTHAMWPVLLQMVYYHFMGTNLHPLAMFVLYTLAFQINGIHQVRVLQRIAQK